MEATLVRAALAGFTDVDFILHTGFALLLASTLGAIIAYHPASRRSVDTLEEVEAQKVFVLYAAIGAITGTMVLKYGTVVGFVVFGESKSFAKEQVALVFHAPRRLARE